MSAGVSLGEVTGDTKGEILEPGGLSDIFGIDFEDEPPSRPAVTAGRKRSGAKARPSRAGKKASTKGALSGRETSYVASHGFEGIGVERGQGIDLGDALTQGEVEREEGLGQEGFRACGKIEEGRNANTLAGFEETVAEGHSS